MLQFTMPVVPGWHFTASESLAALRWWCSGIAQWFPVQHEGLAGHAERASGAYRHRAAKRQKIAAKRDFVVQHIEVATIGG